MTFTLYMHIPMSCVMNVMILRYANGGTPIFLISKDLVSLTKNKEKWL